MSVYVYKDGERELICPTHLHSALASGWSTEEKPKVKPKAKSQPKEIKTDGDESTDNK